MAYGGPSSIDQHAVADNILSCCCMELKVRAPSFSGQEESSIWSDYHCVCKHCQHQPIDGCEEFPGTDQRGRRKFRRIALEYGHVNVSKINQASVAIVRDFLVIFDGETDLV